MTTRRRRAKRLRPRIVGVIASRTDLDRAIRMRTPPDLFEVRLDCLVRIVGRLERQLQSLRAPLIITARHSQEGGANDLSLRQRRDLLTRFLNCAHYVDVELRSASALHCCSAWLSRKTSSASFHFTISNPHRSLEFSPRKRGRPKYTEQISLKSRRARIHRSNSRDYSISSQTRLRIFVSV